MTRTTHWMRLLRTVAVLAALAMLATACGGGGDADDDAADDTADTADTDTADDDADADADSAADGSTGDVTFDVGVTEEACPDAVNEANGCIYLGLISDLTEGPFAPVSVPVTDAQVAFWRTVNEEGGIGGAFDVDVETYTRDNKYNPEEHNRVYNEIKPDVLALAQSLGSPTTAAIIDDMLANDIVATPGGWTSLYETDDPGRVILESGAPYCVESMNAVDYYAENEGGLESLVIVHVPGDYGADAAVGAMLAGEAQGAAVTVIEVPPTASGGELQGAITQIVEIDPDLVIPAVAPGQLAEIVGGAVAGGFDGRFIGPGPTWNPGLLQSPAAEALQAQYWQSKPWASFDADTPGHEAMRAASPDVTETNWGYTSGWIWSYPLREALQVAYENGDLTRAGLVAAIESLETVDYQGMLPEEAGTFSGDINDQVFRQSMIAEPDPDSVEGTTVISDFYMGPTAESYEFEGACYETVSLG